MDASSLRWPDERDDEEAHVQFHVGRFFFSLIKLTFFSFFCQIFVNVSDNLRLGEIKADLPALFDISYNYLCYYMCVL